MFAMTDSHDHDHDAPDAEKMAYLAPPEVLHEAMRQQLADALLRIGELEAHLAFNSQIIDALRRQIDEKAG